MSTPTWVSLGTLIRAAASFRRRADAFDFPLEFDA
jgi:hypothetical protein